LRTLLAFVTVACGAFDKATYRPYVCADGGVQPVGGVEESGVGLSSVVTQPAAMLDGSTDQGADDDPD
jgi:hypothetical protein